MENKNSIVKFEDTELQISINKNYEIEMDMEELSKAIGFEDNGSLKKMITRNPSLQDREFSYLKKVLNEEGGILKKREKRIFTQDGIYEVALLANTERAKNFRKFARHLITKFRRNEITIATGVSATMNEKLDKMIGVIKDRDEEISDMLDYLEGAKDKFEKIDEMQKDIKDIRSKIDELVDFVNDLSDEVYSSSETLVEENFEDNQNENGVDEEGDK